MAEQKKRSKAAPIAIIASIIAALAIVAVIVFMAVKPGKEWTKAEFNEVETNKTTLKKVEDEFGKSDDSDKFNAIGKNITVKTWDNVKGDDDKQVILIIDDNSGKVYQKYMGDPSKAASGSDDGSLKEIEADAKAGIQGLEQMGLKLHGKVYGAGHLEINSKKWNKSGFDKLSAVETDEQGNIKGDPMAALESGKSYKKIVSEYGKPFAYIDGDGGELDPSLAGQKVVIGLWGNTNGDFESIVALGFVGSADDKDDYPAIVKYQMGLK